MRQFHILAIVTLVAILTFLPLHSQGRKGIISGHVRDASSGEPLSGAVIFTKDKKSGVSADNSGYYSLAVDKGEVTLLCSFTGFKTIERALTANSSKVEDFEMEPDNETLAAATVFSKTKRDELKIPQLGKQRVDATLVKSLPALMGENDIIRVIQMMPGVQTPSEGATGFSVRGGGVDQNLILMDGAPVYNCGHFLGFLSMFNRFEIENVVPVDGDLISLLTAEEASRIWKTDGERELAITAAAENEGTNINRLSKDNNWDMKGYRSSWWWLKGTGDVPEVTAPIVTVDGEISESEKAVNKPNGAIRPVIWVEMSGNAVATRHIKY